jgi:hypothetical protein
MIERRIKEREIENRVPINMYPVTSAIRIKDNSRQLLVMNDRPQAGQSLKNGTIEVIQNSRTYFMDNKGLGEQLDEKEGYEGVHTRNTYYVGLLSANDTHT